MKKLCEEEKEQIKEMRLKGTSLVEIADLYDVKTSALCKFFQKHNVRVHKPLEITGNTLNKDEFKEVFMCTDLEVGKWINQGMPHEKEMVEGKRRIYKLKFDKELCYKWFRGEYYED